MAQSRHEGSFVWGDFTSAPFASTAPNQFLLRAGGNVGIDTDSPREKLTVEGNIAPATDDKYTLGSSALRWRNMMLSGSVDYVGNLVFADQGNPRMRLDSQGNLHLSGQLYSGSGNQAVAVSASQLNTNAGRDYSQDIRSLAARLQQLESGSSGVATAPLMQRLANLESLVTSSRAQNSAAAAPPPSANPAFQQELARLVTRVQQLESAPKPVAAAVPDQGSTSQIAAINTRVRQIENMALTPKTQFDQLATRVNELAAQSTQAATAASSASKTELASLTTRLGQLEAKPGVDPAAVEQLAKRLQTLEQVEVKPGVEPVAFQQLAQRLQALEQAPAPTLPALPPTVAPAELQAVSARCRPSAPVWPPTKKPPPPPFPASPPSQRA